MLDKIELGHFPGRAERAEIAPAFWNGVCLKALAVTLVNCTEALIRAIEKKA